jgi:hypothetical protein
MSRRPVHSLARAGSALALLLVIAGCTAGGQFDPTEVFDNSVFDSKKKLQGEREPLFPNGVPGAETGVPPDLVKGYQPPPEQAADNAAGATAKDAAAPAAAAEKPKPKPKPKPKVARAPATAVPTHAAHDPVWDQKPASLTQQGGQSPWPAQTSGQPAQTNWPAPPPTGQTQQTAQPAQPNWPNPPASGTSTH